MSAPRTNVERQARRHPAALIGIALAIVVAAIIGVLMAFDAVGRHNVPEGSEIQIDGRTGQPEPGSAEPEPASPAGVAAPPAAPEVPAAPAPQGAPQEDPTAE